MNSMEGIGCKLAWALELERVDSQHPFCLLLIRLTKSHLGISEVVGPSLREILIVPDHPGDVAL